MYLLSRWVLYNMCDWREEPLLVSADYNRLEAQSEGPCIEVPLFHGFDPEQHKHTDGVLYTIAYIDMV